MLRKMYRTTITVLSLALASVCLTNPACQQPAGTEGAASDADDAHGLHVVRNEHLRLIMHELRAIDFDQLARQADQRKLDEQLADVAVHAAALAEDARLIPRLFRETEWSEESRRVYDDLALRLARECSELAALARRKKVDQISRKVDEIFTTCNSCHASFRGPVMAVNTTAGR